MMIRNDDVHVGTDVQQLLRFSEICDKYHIPIIQGITPVGDLQPLYQDGAVQMKNQDLRSALGTQMVSENRELVQFLSSRDDVLGLHGWEHLHFPEEDPMTQLRWIQLGREWMEWFFERSVPWFIAPFNDVDVNTHLAAANLQMTVLDSNGPHLEEILLGREEVPADPADFIFRCHSWRFCERFTYDQLEEIICRLTTAR